MAWIQVVAPLPAVPLHHDDLVHVPQPHLGLQAPLVGCAGRSYFGCGVRAARDQLCVGPVQASTVKGAAPDPEPRKRDHRYAFESLK